jgi:hypothetical protein
MFKNKTLVVFLVLTLSLACTFLSPTTITGSGNVVTQKEPITDFDRVDISHSFEVAISQGEGFSVVIRVDDNLVEHLNVVKSGDSLKIGLKPARSYNFRNAILEAEVTMPELTGLDLSGASNVTITGFSSAEALSVGLSGSSSLHGDIEAGDASIKLSGSSDVTLNGSAGDLTIDASGSSDANLGDFPVADADVKLSGSSTATVNPSGRLDVSASGASNVYYLGDPTLGKINTSGSSTVERK